MKYMEECKEAEKLFHYYCNLTSFDSTLVTDDYPDDWIYHWSFKCAEEYLEEPIDGRWNEEDDLYYTNIPMWSTWWQASVSFVEFMDRHLKEIADLGFIIIYHDNELWGLGINGAGFDFYEAYWIPLAKLYGLIEED